MPAGKKLIEDVAALIPDHKPGVSIGWILGQRLSWEAFKKGAAN